MRYAYPATFESEEDGRVSVLFDGLPGATWGDTREEALARAADLLVSSLAIFVEDNQPIPRPSPARGRPLVPVPALVAAKLALHDAMLAARISNVELGRRLGLDEKQVRRLRDPLHRSHIDKVEAALRILGKRLEVEAKEAA
jgi:antitoxin HicB